MKPLITRVALWILAAEAALVAVPALLAPRYFYDSFPLWRVLGRHAAAVQPAPASGSPALGRLSVALRGGCRRKLPALFERPQLGTQARGCTLRRGGAEWARRRSGGSESVAVELQEVVGGHQQPPFGSDGRSAATQEPVHAAVGLHLAKDGFDAALASQVELLAPVGREHAAGEVVKPAAPARPGFLAPVGVGSDQRRMPSAQSASIASFFQ
jgi:hypothetical protein